MRLNKLHRLSAMLAFALFSGAIFYLILSTSEQPSNNGYLTSHDVIDNMFGNSSYNEKKIALKKQQVAALTIKLAESANIPEHEFNFDKLLANGAPSSTTSDISQKYFSQLLVEITQLENSLGHEENKMEMLESLTLGHHIENTRYLSGRPITKGWLSSYYGVRKGPFNGRATIHKGINFAGKEDGDIISTESTVVSWADERHGYGLTTHYAHNKNILVNVGGVVTKGQVNAKMGSTGRSIGPHVHYEVLHNNKQIDPLNLFIIKPSNKKQV
jgi:murein DD-endopeptidase MepM/ murein hydrolase activator NlpD